MILIVSLVIRQGLQNSIYHWLLTPSPFWERVGVRAYCQIHRLMLFVFECHSPSTKHKSENYLLSQALIPDPSPKREKGEKTAHNCLQFLASFPSPYHGNLSR